MLLLILQELLLLFIYLFIYFLFFHLPGCSGMLRNVPACSGTVPCSGFYRRPTSLDIDFVHTDCPAIFFALFKLN